MELSKYPLDKLLYFAAAVLPGSVALVIFQIESPGSFEWFFHLGFLGYKARLALILLACFVVGYTLTSILNSFLGAIGGVIGSIVAQRRLSLPRSDSAAPWRDPQWRILVQKQLGDNAPSDTQLISDAVVALSRSLIAKLPESERQLKELELDREKLNAEIDDSRWEEWYNHYHQIVLTPGEHDFFWHVSNGLNFNLQTASLYVLFSAMIIPAVRHWWCIVPAFTWVFLLATETYVALNRAVNRWSTLSAQVIYLTNWAQAMKQLLNPVVLIPLGYAVFLAFRFLRALFWASVIWLLIRRDHPSFRPKVSPRDSLHTPMLPW